MAFDIKAAGHASRRLSSGTPVLKLGRHERNELCINSEEVSRRHCRFTLGDGGVVLLQDDGSTHGTFVNGVRLQSKISLPVGPDDAVRLGSIRPIDVRVAPAGRHLAGLDDDLLSLVLEKCPLPALRAVRATDTRLRRLARRTVQSAAWLADHANEAALRQAMWCEGDYVLRAIGSRGMGLSNPSVSLHPSSSLVATGLGFTARLWHAPTANHWKSFDHPARVMCVALGPARVATGCADGVVRVWCTGSGELVATVSAHHGGGGVCALAWIAAPPTRGTAHWLVSSGADGSIKLWSDDHKRISVCTAHAGVVGALCAGAATVASGAADAKVRVWSIEPLAVLRSLVGHREEVTSVALGRACAISGSVDGQVRVWSLRDCTCTATLDHASPVSALALSGPTLFSSGGTSLVRVWDLESGRLVAQWPGSETVCALAAKAGYVVSGTTGGALCVRQLPPLPRPSRDAPAEASAAPRPDYEQRDNDGEDHASVQPSHASVQVQPSASQAVHASAPPTRYFYLPVPGGGKRRVVVAAERTTAGARSRANPAKRQQP